VTGGSSLCLVRKMVIGDYLETKSEFYLPRSAFDVAVDASEEERVCLV
jgi:uncharacterized protein YozE (UPF0346 family)